MKARTIIFRILPFALVAALVLALAFYPKPSASAREKQIVEIWNVDTFEGGKGSRTAFLSKVAMRVESDGDVRYLVASYTAEGALAALSGGMMPDVLSFGLGLGDFAPYATELPGELTGGRKECAVPWCRGKYFLFSLDGTFGEGETAISCGGSNLPAVAAAYAGICGEELSSSAAYTGFLAGEYRCLLGTQRDVCRFSSRGTEVFSRELKGYCDLFQYVCVLGEGNEAALAFVGELLSARTRGELGSIGMYPAEEGTGERAPAPFCGRKELAELADAARAGQNVNFLDKFLKTI